MEEERSGFTRCWCSATTVTPARRARGGAVTRGNAGSNNRADHLTVLERPWPRYRPTCVNPTQTGKVGAGAHRRRRGHPAFTRPDRRAGHGILVGAYLHHFDKPTAPYIAAYKPNAPLL